MTEVKSLWFSEFELNKEESQILVNLLLQVSTWLQQLSRKNIHPRSSMVEETLNKLHFHFERHLKGGGEGLEKS